MVSNSYFCGFVFVAALLVVCGVGWAEGMNLVTNPGFEGTANQEGLPGAWSTYIPGATATMRVDKTQFHDGKASVLIQTESDVKAILVSDQIPVAPGEKLSLSVWCRVESMKTNMGGSLLFSAGFLNKDRHYSTWHRERPVPTKEKEWFQAKFDTVVPPGIAFMTFQMGIERMTAKTFWDQAEVLSDSSCALRFNLSSSFCEPGVQELPMVLINRDPQMKGKSMTITSSPGDSSQELKISDVKEATTSVRFNLTKRGNVTLEAILSDRATGAKVFSVTEAVTVPELLRTEPVVPTHFCIEDGTPSFEGRIWIHADADKRSKFELICAVKSAGKNLAEWRTSNLPPNPVPFAMTVKDASPGDYEVELLLKSGDKVVAKEKLDWHVIKRSQTEVKLGADGYLLVGGKPIFPIGIFNGGRFEEQAKAGFNVSHGYNAFGTKPGEIPDNARAKAFLDDSLKNEMKCLMLVTHGGHGRNADGEFEHRVRMFKNHPGLLAWCEEEGIARGEMKLPNLENMWKIVKKYGPEHPFMVGDSRDEVFKVKDRSDFFPVDFMDMGMWWWYPFPISPEVKENALQGEQASTSLELIPPSFLTEAKMTKPIWVGIQAYRKPDRTDGRFPTPEEYRAQAYIAVIHGAKGLMYYVGSGSKGNGILNKPEEGNWEYLKKLASELREMSPTFMSRDAASSLTIMPTGAPISKRLKETPTAFVLMAANRGSQAVDVTFNTAKPTGKVEVLYENRTVELADWRIKDRFEPYAVHIYRMAK